MHDTQRFGESCVQAPVNKSHSDKEATLKMLTIYSNKKKKALTLLVGWDNTVSTATHYGLSDPENGSWCWKDFLHPPSLIANGDQVIPRGTAAMAWH